MRIGSRWRGTFCVALVAAAALALVPASASATGCSLTLTSGRYEIRTAADLQGITSCPMSGTYVLLNDIALDPTATENIAPIPVSGSFQGTFDGNGKTISGMRISRPASSQVGLFRAISSATIRDVTFRDARVSARDNAGVIVGYAGASTLSGIVLDDVRVSGSTVLGGVIGATNGATRVTGVQMTASQVQGTGSAVGGVVGSIFAMSGNPAIVNADIEATVTGTQNVGGIAGMAAYDLFGTLEFTIEDSTIRGTTSGTANVGGALGLTGGGCGGICRTQIRRVASLGAVTSTTGAAGGILGGTNYTCDPDEPTCQYQTPIANAFARGAVTGSVRGGLVGAVSGSTAGRTLAISTSYATGLVTASGGGTPGALIGSGATATGVSVATTFWNPTDSDATSTVGTQSTAAAMRTITPYTGAGWTIADGWASAASNPTRIWGICDANAGLPFLIRSYSADPCTPPCPLTPVAGRYEIRTAADLRGVVLCPLNGNYALMNDIALDSTVDDNAGPIGREATGRFTGSFDGGDHEISGLRQSSANPERLGLFGTTDGATIMNLTLRDVRLSSANAAVGAVVGMGFGTSLNHIVVRDAELTVTGDGPVGGVVGQLAGGYVGDASAEDLTLAATRPGGIVGAASITGTSMRIERVRADLSAAGRG
ncbi:MAG: hypothetical protein ACR2J9_09085, partial [Gaiellales bacterium]